MATYADVEGPMYQAAAQRQWDIYRVWVGRSVSGYVDTVLDPEVATTIARLDREVENRKACDDMAEMGEWPVHRAVLRGAHTHDELPGACNRCLDESPVTSDLPPPDAVVGSVGVYHGRRGI